jgi:hypothetical protein
VSGAVDKHLDEAFASPDHVPARELHATAEALGRRRDGLSPADALAERHP